MPVHPIWVDRSEILTYEEIARVASILTGMGVSKIRLTADGKVVPCLFSLDEYDVKSRLRDGSSDSALRDWFRSSFWLKSQGVEHMIQENIELRHIRPMHAIGG